MLQFILIAALTSVSAYAVPKELVNVQKYEPSIVVDLRYLTTQNFLGRKVVGYFKNTCYLSEPAAKALAGVQKGLRSQGYSLKVHDCTRPQRAVDDFVAWAADLSDQKTKTKYYPEVEKSELFNQGYIASKSGHSRGSTVDLTIVKINSKNKKLSYVDMGSPFDFFGEISHTENEKVKPQHMKNRMILVQAMKQGGFKNYAKEWWHYTLESEPYPETYFDFEVR